jgi:hypothetical protein
MNNKIKLIVWSADWCGYCHALMDWLTDNNIPFEERDGEKADWLTGYPTVEIIDGDNKRLAVIEGFKREQILGAVKQYNITKEGNA